MIRQLKLNGEFDSTTKDNTVEGKKKKKKNRRKRKTKEEKEKHNQEMREKVNKQLKEIQEKYKKLNKKKKVAVEEDAEPWGDILTTNQQWPSNDNKTYRLMGQNVNGISYFNDYIEWEMQLNYMDEFQVDTMCINEVNLDTNKPEVRESMFKKLKKLDPYAKMSKSSSPTLYNESAFKMGGTLTITRGNWSGHISDQGSEKLGRWSYQTLEGKNGKQIIFINAYRVCKAKSDSTSGTIRSQQEKDLLEDTGKHHDPREKLLVDLQCNIQKLHEKGHIVVLYGDMNEDELNILKFES